MDNQEKQPELTGFWYSEWAFVLFVAMVSAGIFAGTHMYYMYHIGAFNDIAIVAMLEGGLKTGAYGAAAAFGASFLFARVLEGPPRTNGSHELADSRTRDCSWYQRCSCAG
jgi:uncharacterized protein (TIGR03579 family)